MLVLTRDNKLLSLSGNQATLNAAARIVGCKNKIGDYYKINPKKHRGKLLKMGIPMVKIP